MAGRIGIKLKSSRTKRRAQRSEILRELKHTGALSSRVAHVIEAPTVMSFENKAAAEETRKFFDQLRFAQSLEGRRMGRTMAELASIREITLGAALMLVAEFDRWQRITRSRLLPATLGTWDPGVVSQLFGLGFFKLLRTQVSGSFKPNPASEWIPFISGTKTIGQAARLLRIKLDTLLHRESGFGADLYVALVESMKNAFQHAYPDKGFPEIIHPLVGKRWWMAASIDFKKEVISVAFLDLGITIPKSFPDSWLWPSLAETSRTGGDEVLIAEALQYGRSSLYQGHRGKGFGNIRHPTMLGRGNTVTVVSGRGVCVDVGRAVLAFGGETPLGGTLIQWKLHIPRETDRLVLGII